MSLLKGIALSSPWINSKPLRFENVLGKVVLVDFWTYSCVNCIRTISHMNKLYKKYSKKGLVVIGVHTPEFDFEKIEKNVKDAVKELEIKYPIVMDNDYHIWNYFSNSYWPRQYIFDSTGEQIYDHIGEGGYTEIEEKICELLGIKFTKKDLAIPNHDITQEIYLGSLKHTGFGNSQVCRPGSCITYIDLEDHVEGKPYLSGQWIQNPDSIKPASEGSIALRYTASECNIVADGSTTLAVTLNGKPLTKETAGDDIRITKTGSFVKIDRAGIYNIVKTKNVETNEVKISNNDKNFEAFTFTFG